MKPGGGGQNVLPFAWPGSCLLYKGIRDLSLLSPSGSGTDWGSPSLEDACGLHDLPEAHPLTR